MRTITRARATAIALLSALLAIVTPRQATAQNAVINGKVSSEFGQAIEGANVYINEMSISVTTNAQGDYTIAIPNARVTGIQVNLRVRAVGYAPQVRPLRVTAGTQTFNFQMKQDVNRLDEIVVTGTVGGTERAKVPFAVGRLSEADMPVPALDPLRALAGKVAGVRIAQTSGRPGSTAEVMMRGPTSINAQDRGQSPLIIVDNAIMNVGSLEELGALDIESVEVVKGAAGASLYGTRAANGVITIKTKRGSSQEGVRFNVRSEYGFGDLNSIDWGQPVNHHLQIDETGKRFCTSASSNIAGCSQTVDWMTEIMRINNVNADTTRTPQSIQYNVPSPSTGDLQNVFQGQSWPGQYYNILAQIATQNPTSLQAVDAQGKLGSVRFYVSGSLQDERGALKALNGIQQRRGRVNLDYDARRDLLVSVSSLYDNGINDLNTAGTGFGGLLRGAIAGTNYLARDTLGRGIVKGAGTGLRGTGNGGGNFVYNPENSLNNLKAERFLGNLTSTYFPTDWVTLEGTFAYDTRNRVQKIYEKKGFRTTSASTSDNNGNMFLGHRSEQSMNGSVTSTFRRQVTPDLNGKLQFRALYDQDDLLTNNNAGEVFLVKDIYTLTNTSTNKTATSTEQTTKNMGYFAGTSLDYKGRYIFDGTFRYDGSSRFGSQNRWAPFGRVSGVWRVSEESFWNVPHMSDFRLRASRGTAGSTPNFQAQYETYTVTATGIQLGQAGNSKLKPETTTEVEVGTDFTLFDRLGVELTHANAVTKDQILLVNTSAALGFSQQWQNAGTLQNKTWELGLNLPVLNRRDLSWSMRGTWDRTRTVITHLFAPEYVTDAGTGQGTGSFFRITDSTQYRRTNGLSVANGFQPNRYGNIWGRKFYRSCKDMAAALQSQCGDGLAYQKNDEGYIVWVGQGHSWRDGITNNLWQTILPTCTAAVLNAANCIAAGQSPFGNAPLYWGMPILDRPLAGEPGMGTGIQQILGNVFPNFRFTYSNNVQYKRVTFYALLDGTIGHDIYNQGEGWGLLDYASAHFDQAGKTVETAKPVGYSWRTGPSEGAGIGGFYDILGPNNYVVEDGSYAKVRELSLTYKVGQVHGVGDWTVGLVGRNLLTFTKYTGYDPEVGATGGNNQTGSGLINQVDAFGFPTLRTMTLSLSSRF